jgi:hypothetical protein
MDKAPLARYSVCTITTKDIELYKRSRVLQQEGYTAESIYRRGIEELEQDSIKNMTQNNKA